MISLANMKHRATVERIHPTKTLGKEPEYDTMYTDRPCRLLPETTAVTASGFGRIATGRWALLFQAGTVIKPADMVTVKAWDKTDKVYKQVGIYEIETAICVDTHTEAVANERG